MKTHLAPTSNFDVSYNETNNKYPVNLVTDDERQLFAFVNYVILCGPVSLLGLIANIINMLVFYKQGLNTTINISFFAMAGSDLCCLILQLWYTMCISQLLEKSGAPMVLPEIHFITGGVPREAFARITCLITVYITAERCLCIVFPLHIKQIITPKTTTIIITSIILVTWLSGLPLYFTSYIDWKFYPDLNITLLGLVVRSHHDVVEGAVFFIHAIFGVLTFLAVLLLTSILIYKLRQKLVWRQEATTPNGSKRTISKRDQTTMFMVVFIATIVIVCYTPSVVLCVTTFCEPEFRRGGKYFNLYYILWSFALLFENINSSVNILLYLKMSTKFRQTFQEIFVCFGPTKTIIHSTEVLVYVHTNVRQTN